MAELLELRIRRFNMYQTGKVYDFPNDGEKALLRDKIIYKPTIYDETHTVKTNDTIWGIAYQHYRDKVPNPSRYWWIIADVNNIFKPHDISELIGTKIIIPSITNVELNS